jgi:hypothetical protein
VKYRIDKSGNVTAVYSDILGKLRLGDMQVQRASNVEFNHASQEWEARTPGNELIAHGALRDEVIREEVRVIEARL